MDFGPLFKAKLVNEGLDFDLLNHCTKLDNLSHYSATAITRSQMFLVLLMHVRSHLNDSLFWGYTKNPVTCPCYNIRAIRGA